MATETTTTRNARRRLEGVVVSDKMEKTVTVRVDRVKTHPKYRKQYKVSDRYAAHDEKGEAKTGDKVTIEETRPLSKTKRWRVVSVTKTQKEA